MKFEVLKKQVKDTEINSPSDIVAIWKMLHDTTGHELETNDIDRSVAERLFNRYRGRYGELKLALASFWRDACTDKRDHTEIVSKSHKPSDRWLSTFNKTLQEDIVDASPVKSEYAQCTSLIDKFKFLKNKGCLPHDDLDMWKRITVGIGWRIREETPSEHLDNAAKRYGYL